MRFLVTIDASDIGAGLPPEQIGQLAAQMVVPSLEQLAQWEQEGKIHGGGYAGARVSVFVIDADSPEEVDQLLASLPYFPIVKAEVKPLITIGALLERARAIEQGIQERVR